MVLRKRLIYFRQASKTFNYNISDTRYSAMIIIGNGKFEIEIRQTTYDGAYKNIGAYRDHIIHEICHAFLYRLGYTPIMQRSFKNGEIVNYRSSEW